MSDPQFREMMSDDEIICPYCNASFQPECEEYSETSRPHKCECGKQFHMHQEFSVTHFAQPDCELNDEAHIWEQALPSLTVKRCTVCDRYKAFPPADSGSPR